MDIPINAKVNCSDGTLWQRHTLIIMPTTEKITHVVVVSEFYPETRYLVPVERIVESTPETIQLSCTPRRVLKMQCSIGWSYPFQVKRFQFVRLYDVAVLSSGSIFHRNPK